MTSSPLPLELKLTEEVSDQLSTVLEVVNESPDRMNELFTFVDDQLRPVRNSSYWIANVDLGIEYQEFKSLAQLKNKWLEINQVVEGDDDNSSDNDDEEGDDDQEDDETTEDERPYQVHTHFNRVMFSDTARDLYVFSHRPN